MKILYYSPNAVHSGGITSRWIYGLDLIQAIEMIYPEWDFIEMKADSKLKLREMYATSDCLLRPSRHDGYSFGVQEALHFKLPVLHTYPIPGVILIKAELRDVEEKLIELEKSS